MDPVTRRGALEAGALALVIAVAGALRWPFVMTGLWRDEAITVADTAGASLGASLHAIALAEISPPGYFLAMRAWIAVAGRSELALKMPSFVCGLVVVGGAFVLGRRLAGFGAGLLAAALAAFAQEGIVLAGDARPYALAAALAALAAYCALRVLAGDGRRFAIAYALAACAIMAVQYTGLVLVAGIAAVAVPRAFRGPEPAGARRLLAATAAAALAYLPLVPQFVRTATADFPWRSPVTADTLFGRTAEQFSYVLPLDVAHVALALECALALVGVALAFRHRLAGGAAGNSCATAYAALVVPILLATVLETRARLGDPRYMFVFTPLADALLGAGLCALAGAIFAAWRARRRDAWSIARAALASAIVVTIAGAAPKQLALDRRAFATPELSGMRAAVGAAQADLAARTLVLIAPDYLAPAFRYYAPDPHLRVIGFATRERPEVARWEHASDPWFVPGLVDRAERDVRARVKRERLRLVIVSDRDAGDAGSVPYSLAAELRRRLIARARVLRHRVFPGRLESVELTVLDAP
ncbi:MAG: hypothetical protein NVS3B16_00340 [Vulcanimicrobiaceae bacterium]